MVASSRNFTPKDLDEVSELCSEYGLTLTKHKCEIIKKGETNHTTFAGIDVCAKGISSDVTKYTQEYRDIT